MYYAEKFDVDPESAGDMHDIIVAAHPDQDREILDEYKRKAIIAWLMIYCEDAEVVNNIDYMVHIKITTPYAHRFKEKFNVFLSTLTY